MSVLAVLYVNFNTATLNINEMSNQNKKRSSSLPLRFSKKKYLFNLGNFIDIAPSLPYFKNANFILYVGCNNKKKLKVTLKFTLLKVTFKKNQLPSCNTGP